MDCLILFPQNHQFRHAVLPQIQGGHRLEAVILVGAILLEQFFQCLLIGFVPWMLFLGICGTANNQNRT